MNSIRPRDYFGWMLCYAGFFATSWCVWACGSVAGEEIQDHIGFSIGLVSPFGIDAYVPQKWGGLNVQLVNPTSEPRELFASTYFEDEPTLQFGRRVWVPPRSRMQTWHPILLPKVGDEVRLFNLRTLVMDAKQDRDVLIRSDSGYLQFDSILRRTQDSQVTGMIDSLNEVTDENSAAAYELVVASRLGNNLKRIIKLLPDRMVPAGDECLQALDQLVIADSRVANDDVGMAAIRRWLFGGGHLWVMLDRVDPRALELLLGDEFVGQVVDRVGLTTVRMEAAVDLQGRIERWTQDFEQPVELVRVVVSNVDVAFTVDGWPAAFTKNCGDGRLLVTTLGPQGWMRPRTANDSPKTSGPRHGELPTGDIRSKAEADAWAPGKYVALTQMQNLAADFFETPPAPLLPDVALEPQIQEYVGYAIPSRWLIVSLLIGLSGLLAGWGAWLWRIDRLELMGAIGPGMAVAVSLVLVLLGWHQRQVVPATLANLQFVQIIPGTDDVRVHGVAGLFAAEAGTSSISAQHGGWFLPEMTGQHGTTRRMVWTDLGTWQWENLPETAGLRSARFLQSGMTSERIEAHATFGPDGVIGHLRAGAEHRPTDVILATRDGRLGVELREDGTFTARPDNVFAHEQYLASGLLSDEQNRRHRTLQHLLTDPLRLDYPAAPQLLFWTDPWDLGFRAGVERRSLGAALVAVPLQWDRPLTGTEMAISAPFLPYVGTFGPNDEAPSGLWDYHHHSWLEKSLPTSTWLQFQFPKFLLPVQILSGRIVVRVTGPVGKLEFAGLREQAIVPLKTWIDPVGTLIWDITDTDFLNVSAEGGMLLRLSGGDPDRPELTNGDMKHGDKTNFWQIESLMLDLRAKTIDPP